MEVYQTPSLTGAEIASRLSKVNFEPEDMFPDGDPLGDLEGLNVRREVKTRRGHTQWAKIIRANNYTGPHQFWSDGSRNLHVLIPKRYRDDGF